MWAITGVCTGIAEARSKWFADPRGLVAGVPQRTQRPVAPQPAASGPQRQRTPVACAAVAIPGWARWPGVRCETPALSPDALHAGGAPHPEVKR